MTTEELRDELDRRFVVVERDGPDLVVRTLFPDVARLTDELREELRTHKPELLRRLEWEEEADALLLASSCRLAEAWPRGCPLDDETWRRLEEALTKAYRDADEDKLADALEEREEHARNVFKNHKDRAA